MRRLFCDTVKSGKICVRVSVADAVVIFPVIYMWGDGEGRCSSVSTVTRLRTVHTKVSYFYSLRIKIFISCIRTTRSPLEATKPSVLWVSLPGPKANHSPSVVWRLGMSGVYLHSHLRLRGSYRDLFVFVFTMQVDAASPPSPPPNGCSPASKILGYP
jgi:hypothetical protein